MYQPTQRTYTEKQTGKQFTMYQHPETGQSKLVSEETGEEIRSFYASAFTDLTVKFSDNSTVELSRGEFTRIENGIKPIARKFFMQKRFTNL